MKTNMLLERVKSVSEFFLIIALVLFIMGVVIESSKMLLFSSICIVIGVVISPLHKQLE
jgi:hypothetical protein